MSTQPSTIRFPKDLHQRAKELAARLGSNLTQFIHESLRAHCLKTEQLLDMEAERKQRDADLKRGKRRRALGLDNGSVFAPVPETLNDDLNAPLIENNEDSSTPIYLQHAEKITTTTDPIERRLIELAAIKAVREWAPITSPSDRDILLRLTTTVAKLRAQTPTTPVTPPPSPIQTPTILEHLRVVNRTRKIDPIKTPTFGNAEPIEEE